MPQPSTDGTGYWQLTKDWGAQQSLEAVVCGARRDSHPEAADVLFHRDDIAAVPTVQFNVVTGVCTAPPEAIGQIFSGDGTQRTSGRSASAVDYAVILARDTAVHVWRPINDQLLYPTGAVAWRRVSFSDADTTRGLSELHPAVRVMLSSSCEILDDTVHVPTSACPLMEEAHASRVTLLGSAMMPIDPFEFRGDRVMVDIEDATSLCRRLYTQRYHRGFTPTDFREYEMDCLTKRLHCVQRDLQDADMFLNALEEISQGTKGEEEEVRQVSDS